MNRQKPARDEGVLQTPNWPAGTDISMSRLALILETPLSLQPEMCGHLAKDCLRAAERTEVPNAEPSFSSPINIERRRNSDFVIYC